MPAYGTLSTQIYDADKPRAPSAEIAWYAERLPDVTEPIHTRACKQARVSPRPPHGPCPAWRRAVGLLRYRPAPRAARLGFARLAQPFFSQAPILNSVPANFACRSLIRATTGACGSRITSSVCAIVC
jgi:hypothetical protein